MTPPATTFPVGADLRQPQHRREAFLRFYDFHTRHGTHPGLVYLVIPFLEQALGWTKEQTLWFAFLNGCTQHPPSTLALVNIASEPADASRLTSWLADNPRRVPVDTDRRYHRKAIAAAVDGYVAILAGRPAVEFWGDAAAQGWSAVWKACTSIPTFGRLSAWSFCDYLLCAGVPVNPDNLMLEDHSGSRSHRNGLAIVTGRNGLDWHQSNPTFDGTYTRANLEALENDANGLLAEAQRRATGQPHHRFVNRLTLESALCTYKSFHRPNRRYPNVYTDMMHDRLVAAEKQWPGLDLNPLWQARATLPRHLLLECNPADPGCTPMKQNWYRLTGELPHMGHDYPDMPCELDALIAAESLGHHRESRC